MSLPKSHPFPFDPSYGMDLAGLKAVRPPKPVNGFAEYWRRRHAEAIRCDPEPEIRESPIAHPRWQVFDLTYRSTDRVKISGWLLLPAEGEIRRGLVVTHGYGGRDGPDFDIPIHDAAILFPCLRGLSRSARPEIPQNPSEHVITGIEDPKTYVIGGCVEDVWLGLSALLSLYPHLLGHIGYSGISFGGGIGALAIPFEPRLACGHLALPTFGDQRRRLALPSVGSAEGLQRYAVTHPDVADRLQLFDAAAAASFIDVPMLCAVARFDPAVAPPCQFAIANAIERFNEIFILDAGHFSYPGEAEQQAALAVRLEAFFAAL